MDMDINNQQALTAGAYYQAQMTAQQNWRPMNTAPRDGTVIEIQCTYGVAPWFGLFKWTGEMQVLMQDGSVTTFNGDPRWAGVPDSSRGIGDEGSSFSWRPYAGDTQHYADPTGGLQDSPAYWRGAVAAKYGLPLNHFEKETARNVAVKNATAPRVAPTVSVEQPKSFGGFWRWLFGAE